MIDLKIYEPAYKAQIRGCKRKVDVLGNPVEMRMSLQQFADKWDQSGHWDQRGRKKGEYCMARIDDLGHYEWDNVKIILHSENVTESQIGNRNHMFGKTQTLESNAKRSATLTGRPAWNKGKPSPKKGRPEPKLQCVHCGKWAAPNMMKRWHGDNCKKSPRTFGSQTD